jgi:toxin-antitoxin system PIN domain toxin
MILPDVNVLIYAHREDSPDHDAYRGWLESSFSSDQLVGISDLVLSGFLRIVTNSRIYKEPTSMETALLFADQLRSQPNSVTIQPGPKHWEIFARLCRDGGVRGGLVTDAYFAALAIEWDGEWVTNDRDFSRFQGLRWRHPLP